MPQLQESPSRRSLASLLFVQFSNKLNKSLPVSEAEWNPNGFDFLGMVFRMRLKSNTEGKPRGS